MRLARPSQLDGVEIGANGNDRNGRQDRPIAAVDAGALPLGM